MDNFFEVLIYLIIIISFLSSLFKKKEQPKAPPSQQGSVKKQPSDGFSEFESESVEVESSGYDILSEIENIFNQELGKPKQRTESEIKPEPKIRDRSLEADSINYDKFELEKKAALDTQKRFQRREITVDARTETAAMMFEELLKKQRAKSLVSHPIIKKIKNPQMIKDYIIVSEILNKPLALRK